MIYIEVLTATPNPVEVKKEFTVTVEIREEYENPKKYKNRYPHRYGEQKK